MSEHSSSAAATTVKSFFGGITGTMGVFVALGILCVCSCVGIIAFSSFSANQAKDSINEVIDQATEISTETESEQQSTDSSVNYQSIYDIYSARLRAECPTISLIDCAKISTEGATEMAKYMYKAKGTDGQYGTYSDWAQKLTDVYQDEALKQAGF